MTSSDTASGPRGGFSLGRDPDEIRLLNIYEAIDGPFHAANCLLDRPTCDVKACVLGGLLHKVNLMVDEYLRETTLGMIAKANEESV